MDFIKMEVKQEEEALNETEVIEEETYDKCHACSPHCQVRESFVSVLCTYSRHLQLFVFHFQGPKAILMRQTSHDLATVSDLYSLLEDFKRMARSSKSLLCCQPAGCQSILMCQLCGEYFTGKADRMLKLCEHYESVHPSDALNLIIESMERYNMLIGHMRKALEFDEWFGDLKYTISRGTKCFHCTKCRDCC